MATKQHDPARQRRIDEQSEWVAGWIGADPESVMTDGNYGTILTPDQFDKTIAHVRSMGFQDAIDLLRASGQEFAAGMLESAK